MCAYDKTYLEKARTCLGRMLDFAVNERGFELDAFFDLFIGSGLAGRFGRGDPSLIVGKSGVELTWAVFEESGLPVERMSVQYPIDRSPEYWVGWALAYYQWLRSISFARIASVVPPSAIRDLYPAFHEMDVKQLVDRIDELFEQANPTTQLQQRRVDAGLSQRQLADLSGVPVRTIQQYEQRQKDITHAAFATVNALARALSYSPGDIA